MTITLEQIEAIIDSSNDHQQIVEKLLDRVDKWTAISGLLNIKLNGIYNKKKTLLIEQSLNSLNGLIPT